MAEVLEEVHSILDDLKHSTRKINEHGQRADDIVSSMLMHSRGTSGEREEVDLNQLILDYCNLSFHGMRATQPGFNADIKNELDPLIGKMNLVPQDIGRVILNLLNNAFYAVFKRQQLDGTQFQPEVLVQSIKKKNHVQVCVSDNGMGIPSHLHTKVMEPFYSTKPSGEGTGLGLSLSYEIITQAHGGQFSFESKEGEGTTFFIELPIADE